MSATRETKTTRPAAIEKSGSVGRRPQVEQDDEDEVDDENWEDVSSEESEDDRPGAMPRNGVEKKAVVETAAQNNVLLHAILTHPQFNRSSPQSSPKPLFYAADFIRRTYLEYLLPLLPAEAIYKSSKLANKYIFVYSDNEPGATRGDTSPCPTEPADDWLADDANWPRDLDRPGKKESYMDAVGRTHMVCMAITDPVKGALIMQGRFDWDRPVDIAALARAAMASGSS